MHRVCIKAWHKDQPGRFHPKHCGLAYRSFARSDGSRSGFLLFRMAWSAVREKAVLTIKNRREEEWAGQPTSPRYKSRISIDDLARMGPSDLDWAGSGCQLSGSWSLQSALIAVPATWFP